MVIQSQRNSLECVDCHSQTLAVSCRGDRNQFNVERRKTRVSDIRCGITSPGDGCSNNVRLPFVDVVDGETELSEMNKIEEELNFIFLLHTIFSGVITLQLLTQPPLPHRLHVNTRYIIMAAMRKHGKIVRCRCHFVDVAHLNNECNANRRDIA